MEEVDKKRKEFQEFLKEVQLKSAYRENYIIRDLGVGDGWLDLLKELIQKLIAAGWDKSVADVKEKFGGLRFYVGHATDDIFDLIDEYEDKSYYVCEVCGEEGELRKGGWLRTLCHEHFKEE